MSMPISGQRSPDIDAGRVSINSAGENQSEETKSADAVAKKTGIFPTLKKNIRSKFFKTDRGKIPSSSERLQRSRLPIKKLISLIARHFPKRANKKGSIKPFVENWKDSLTGNIKKEDAENIVTLMTIHAVVSKTKSGEESLSQLEKQGIVVDDELFGKLEEVTKKLHGAPESKEVCLKAYGEACKKLDISPDRNTEFSDLISDAIANLKSHYLHGG